MLDNYHSLPALGSTDIKHLAIGGYKRYLDSKRPDFYASTKALDFGTIFHLAVLEPHKLDDLIAVAPDVDRRTKSGKAIHDGFTLRSANKLIVSSDDWTIVRAMADCALGAHVREWQDALLLGEREREGFGHAGDVPIKGRADLLDSTTVWDLKTTSGIDDLMVTIQRYRYDLQALHYMRLFDKQQFILVFVEKSRYPRIRFIRLQRSYLEASSTAQDYERALTNYTEQQTPLGIEDWAS